MKITQKHYRLFKAIGEDLVKETFYCLIEQKNCRIAKRKVCDTCARWLHFVQFIKKLYKLNKLNMPNNLIRRMYKPPV